MDKDLKRAISGPEVYENVDENKKKKRDVSVAWDHFKKSDDKTYGVCNYCGKSIKTSGNTTNLMAHLKHVHADRLKIGTEQKTIALQLHMENSTTFYNNDSVRKRNLDNKVMNMIAVDIQPFSCVEDQGFRELIKELDPRYKLPSRSHLRDVVLPAKYESLRNKLISILANIDSLALTTDLWTSRANAGYITITCHYVTNGFELKSAVLATRQLLEATNHNASNISETIKAVLDDWGIFNKIVCVVTDNDPTMIKACRLLEYNHLPCVAHTLNLLVQDILKLTEMDIILTKCKKIVSFFKKSQIAYAKFKEAQGVDNPYTLLQETPTRWNSAYAMIKRILMTNESITIALVKSYNAPQPFLAEEVDILRDVSELLSPFEDATVLVSSNTNVSISLIIPVICELLHKINKIMVKTQEGNNILAYIKMRLPERLATYELKTIPRVATIIDPRFKKHGFLLPSNAEEAAKAVQDMLFLRLSANPQSTPLEPPTPTQEPTRFSFLKEKTKTKVHSSWADAIILMRQYIEKDNQPEECSPLTYWKMASEADAFKSLAKKFFCVPASSCESERIFSKAGQLISDRRTRLSSTVVDKLLFLNKNEHIDLDL